MPLKPTDHSKSLVYKFTKDGKDLYVGSTTSFTKRKSQHKKDCNNPNSKNYNTPVYVYIRSNGGWDSVVMVLVQLYPECKSSIERKKYERQHYDLLMPQLNACRPIRYDGESYNRRLDVIAHTTAKNITIYFETKSVIYEIFDNSFNDESTDFTKKTFINETFDGPNIFVNKIFGLYLSFKIFDILRITKNDIEDMFDDSMEIIKKTEWSFEKSKYLEPILKLVQTLPIQNTFKAICAFKNNRTNLCKNEYRNHSNILNFAFKSIGLKVQLNRQDPKRLCDRIVQIIRTDSMGDNAYDDLFCQKVVDYK
jgi:hypothetical protein